MIRAWLIAAFAVLTAIFTWVTATALTADWSMAQRVLTNFVLPVGWLWLAPLAVSAYQLVRGRRLAGGLWLLVHAAIGIAFCPLVANALMSQVEAPLWPSSPVAAESPRYRAIVVLGGAAGRNYQGHNQVYGDGERMVMAAKLWHAGKTDWVICTGTVLENPAPIADQATGSGIVRDNRFHDDDPATVGRELLVELGVPDDRILRSGGQHTTAEMTHLLALFTAWSPTPPDAPTPPGAPPIVPTPHSAAEHDPGDSTDDRDRDRAADDRPIGLITNAFHLPRAERLAAAQPFADVGVHWLPIPAGSNLRTRYGMAALQPEAEAGLTIARGCKELLAKLVGR